MTTAIPTLKLADYFVDVSTLRPGEVVIRDGDSWLLFSSHSSIVRTALEDEVLDVVRLAEAHVERGGWAAGFVAYEAGPAFDRAILGRQYGRPLVWFALFDRAPTRFSALKPAYEPIPVELLELDTDEAGYRRGFAAVKGALAAGITYQVNLTMRQRFRLSTGVPSFFAARCGVNPPPYAAFINGGEWRVASFSPELFFERTGSAIVSKPMKGTVPRPADKQTEVAAANALAADPKSIAENIMIVDMVRNDLGRIAEMGTVRVTDLLKVERHGGLLQMTSTVHATSRASTLELLQALFPPASVTGAPKVSTCALICESEKQRGVYCGAIGFMGPGRERFSVAIRTAWIDEQSGQAEFGIGSGLVWDSDVDAEYAECLAKRDVLVNSAEQWGLLEAIPQHALADQSVVSMHITRLKRAAASFGVEFDEGALREVLSTIPILAQSDRGKVRVLLRLDGSFEVTSGPSAVQSNRLTAELARTPVDSADPSLRFKTTSRGIYQRHLDAHPEVDEVLLFNERGELTEFCRGNVVLRVGGCLVTPAPEAGCLDGVGVARLIQAGRVELGRPKIADLANCDETYFVNSVVGLVPVDLTISARTGGRTSPRKSR